MKQTTFKPGDSYPEDGQDFTSKVESYPDRETSHACALAKYELGLGFLDDASFLQALTHRSFIHESPDWPFKSNEKLEFLGDAALDLYITDRLIELYPDLPEGDLSRFRGALVNESSLVKWSQLLGIPKFILLGKGERKEASDNYQICDSIMADALEALLGAAYQAGGYQRVITLLDLWIERWNTCLEIAFFELSRLKSFDPKSRLQEISLSLYKELPEYRSEEIKPGFFKVELFLAGEFQNEMILNSKKKAEKKLAEQYLALKDLLC